MGKTVLNSTLEELAFLSHLVFFRALQKTVGIKTLIDLKGILALMAL